MELPVGSPVAASRTSAHGSYGGCLPACHSGPSSPFSLSPQKCPVDLLEGRGLAVEGDDSISAEAAVGVQDSNDKAMLVLIGTRLARCCLNLKRAHVLGCTAFLSCCADRRSLVVRAAEWSWNMIAVRYQPGS